MLDPRLSWFLAAALALATPQAARAQEKALWRAALCDELEVLFSDAGRDGVPVPGSAVLELSTPRGVPAGAHLLLVGLEPGAEVRVRLTEDGEPVPHRLFRLVEVPVEENTGLGSRTEQFEGERNPHVVRRAPFRVFEALEPLATGRGVPEGDVLALRLELDVPLSAAPGERALEVEVEHAGARRSATWRLVVRAAVVPPAGRDTLRYTNWFSPDAMARDHGVEVWSEEFWPVLAQYAELMARGRQNTFWVRWNDVFHEDEDGRVELDRARLERYVATFRAAGLFWIEGAPLAGRPERDWSSPWLELRRPRGPATGPEGRAALAHTLGQLDRAIEENGWRGAWLQHLADEPTDVNAEDYRKLAAIVREHLPGVPIVEATMSREVVGAVDIWTPQVQAFQGAQDFFEERRRAGERLWVYTCLRPGGPWINRLLDQERLRAVWIGWAAERYGLEGFLHWGLNHHKADPFEHSVVDHPDMPDSTNKLPAGDSHVVYPGADGPWSGQRFEAHRIGLEDRELLAILGARDPVRAAEVVALGFRAFDDFEIEVGAYRTAKEALLDALDETRPPNVLFLISDDQRPDGIGALGNPQLVTPHLDRLVEEGTAFERAYCMGSFSGAVCAPSRAMILSGRGLHDFVVRPYDPPQEYVLLPEAFRRAGYQTFGTGKWHNGPSWFARSFEDGGAIFFGGMGPHVGLETRPFDPSGAYPAEARAPNPVFSSEAFANEALTFLEERDRSRPFFLYVSFTAPHDPRTPPEEYRALYKPEELPLPENFLPDHPFDNGELEVRDENLAPHPRTPEVVREHLADYYGMISHLDAQVGRILAALEESGERERTIVVFASDHGLAVGSHGLLGKQNLYEHSMGTPLVLGGPGVPRGARSDALVYLCDVFPTLTELAGVATPASVEGTSLAPVLRGEVAGVRERIFTAYKRFQKAVTDGRYKLIDYPEAGERQLFDLEADPHETTNLIASEEHAEIRERLISELAGWDPVAR